MRSIKKVSLRVDSLERATGREELAEQDLAGGGNRRAACGVLADDEVAIERIEDHGARLEADQHAAEVVPGAVSVTAAIHERVEPSARDSAQVERRRAERAVLLPAELARRIARQSDDRRAEPCRARGLDGIAVPPRAAAPYRLEPLTRREVDDERGPRAIRVDRAEADGVPGDAERRVRRAVEGVEHDDDVAVGVVQPALLREDAHSATREHGHRRVVGCDVAVVLTGCRARQTPVVDGAERGRDRGRGTVEKGDELGVVHGRATVLARRGRLVHVAVIDVAGFVADLKDHAVDHGFHVHDERHFVETYSLRQAWEVDLHPEEACGGPLDLHLSLEVDPRALLAFEDAVLAQADDDKPPDGFSFPLMFTWSMPPLPSPPDLLVLATELAGVGGTQLPLEVSAIDSFPSATDAPERSLNVVARLEVGLDRVYLGEEQLCDTLDRCLAVSQYLLERAPSWMDEV